MNDIETIPMEVGIKVSEQIKGTCEYSTFLFFMTKGPSKLAYGAEFEQSGANFGGICTNGAVYDAIMKSNADVIVAPRYFTEGSTFLCIPLIDACMYRNVKVTVLGIRGNYEEIKKMDAKVRELRMQSRLSAQDKSPLSSYKFF